MSKNPPSYLPFLLMMSLVAACIEVDMSVPSFPQITQHFGISESLTQLTVAVNFFGFFIATLIFGPLSDAYGRRPIMVWGTLMMLIGAVGCTFANSFELLMASRFIQGVGASCGPVVAMAMVADSYKGDKAIRLINHMNAFLTTAMAIAPTLGAFVNQEWGWRGNYGTVAIITLLSFVLMAVFLPETLVERKPLNWRGMFWDYIRIHKNKTFVIASAAPSILCGGYFAFIACAPFLYMEAFQREMFTYALLQGSVVGAYALASIFGDKILKTMGEGPTLRLSIGLNIVACVGLLVVGFWIPQSWALFTFFMTLFCLGFALCYPVIYVRSTELFPNDKGAVSSALMSFRGLLLAGGVAFSSYLYNGTPLSVSISSMVFIATGVGGILWLGKVGLVTFKKSTPATGAETLAS